MSDSLDDMIEVLKRAKRGEQNYMKLLKIKDNMLFREFKDYNTPTIFDDERRKWAQHVYDEINECILLIEKGSNEDRYGM